MITSRVIHFPLRPEQELTANIFDDVARKMSEAVREHGDVLVTSDGDPALAACLLIPHLVTTDHMEVGEAARHLERLRPGISLPSHIIVKMEEWSSGSSSQKTRMETVNSVSQSWLPLVFISIFMFLLLRAILCFAGIDTKCVLRVLSQYPIF